MIYMGRNYAIENAMKVARYSMKVKIVLASSEGELGGGQ